MKGYLRLGEIDSMEAKNGREMALAILLKSLGSVHMDAQESLMNDS